MRKILFVLTVSIALPAYSQDMCINVEIHPKTHERMSGVEWQELKDQWASEEPESPGLLNLFFAYNLYSREKKKAEELRSDKQKHCYMGCKIAREVSMETAVYAAWYKEYQDLEDCSSKTYFEWKDYQLTVDGAIAGMAMGNTGSCMNYCKGL